VLKNSIYLTAHIVFIKFPYVDHAELSISINHGNQIRGWVQRISQVMISEFRRQRFDKSPKAVYQNATDLDTLKGPMMAILAST
jgi:hypothetical protein